MSEKLFAERGLYSTTENKEKAKVTLQDQILLKIAKGMGQSVQTGRFVHEIAKQNFTEDMPKEEKNAKKSDIKDAIEQLIEKGLLLTSYSAHPVLERETKMNEVYELTKAGYNYLENKYPDLREVGEKEGINKDDLLSFFPERLRDKVALVLNKYEKNGVLKTKTGDEYTFGQLAFIIEDILQKANSETKTNAKFISIEPLLNLMEKGKVYLEHALSVPSPSGKTYEKQVNLREDPMEIRSRTEMDPSVEEQLK